MFRHTEKQIALDYPILGSSVDSTKVSATWKGTAILFIPLIMWGVALLGLDITEIEVMQTLEHISILVGSFTFLFGILRKIWVRVTT